MKTKMDIEHRLKVLLDAELEQRLKVLSLRLPQSCVHNHRQPLDPRKKVGGEPNEEYNRIVGKNALPVVQTIGLCMLGAEDPETWPGSICEDPLDAKRCSFFTHTQNKAQVIQEFSEQLRDLEWVKTHYPEIYTLLWVLEETKLLQIPWWKRLLLKLRVIRLEPVTPSIDPTKLLPG